MTGTETERKKWGSKSPRTAQPTGQISHTNTVSEVRSKKKTEEKKHTATLMTIPET